MIRHSTEVTPVAPRTRRSSRAYRRHDPPRHPMRMETVAAEKARYVSAEEHPRLFIRRFAGHQCFD